MDLSIGHVTTWFSVASPVPPPQPGFRVVRAIGFDQSFRPLVVVYVDGGTPELWLVTSASHGTQLSGMQVADYFVPVGVTDSHGAWLNGADGIYLFSGTGFSNVATGAYTVAGSCV